LPTHLHIQADSLNREIEEVDLDRITLRQDTNTNKRLIFVANCTCGLMVCLNDLHDNWNNIYYRIWSECHNHPLLWSGNQNVERTIANIDIKRQ
jgi:hypothetical protein